MNRKRTSSSLTAIELKNFRCYKNHIRFPVKPLTIFTGQNSVGKSTLFKALSLYSDTGDDLKMNFSGANAESHGVPDFKSVKNFASKSEKVHFGFQFDDAQFNIEYSQDLEELDKCRVKKIEILHLPSEKVLIRVRFNWNGINGIQIQGHFPAVFNTIETPRGVWGNFLRVLAQSKDMNEARTLHTSEESIASVDSGSRKNWPSLNDILKGSRRFKCDLDSSSTTLYSIHRELKSLPRKISFQLSRELDSEDLISNDRLRALRRLSHQKPEQYQLELERITEELEKQKKEMEELERKIESKGIPGLTTIISNITYARQKTVKVIHLSSKRLVAPRLFQKGDDLYDELSSRSNQLLFSKGKSQRRVHYAKDFFIRWMKELKVGDEVTVENVEGMAVKVMIKDGDHWMNLADRGMGFAQVFRLLFTISTTLLKDNLVHPIILCIEEPDSNLHPEMQSKLIEPIIEAMSINSNLSIYLETHSEYMVRKLMVLAKERQELSQDWAVNYLKKERGAFKVRHVTFGEDGRLSERLGTGFLDEASKLTRELL